MYVVQSKQNNNNQSYIINVSRSKVAPALSALNICQCKQAIKHSTCVDEP